ncbi:agmatinase [Candidatus Nomurabacteria bacterium]|nr:agmatinase [Candidatus Nomurabacteria bacterium]
MIKRFINTKNINEADVVLISAPYEKGATFHKGTAAGPKKIVECLDYQLDWFMPRFGVEPVNFIKTAHVNLKQIENFSPEKALTTIRENCKKILEKDKFIFMLGGEHSVSIGYFEALAKKYNPKDITILQIDAHCDLRKDDSDYMPKPSKLSHCTVMRHANEMGYPLVQVGVRTIYEGEYNYIKDKKNNVKVFFWGPTTSQGTFHAPKIAEILKSIKTKYVYLSIDVDGFDPAHMPATGTPLAGGLEWWYGIELIEKLIGKFNLIGADIVEVSPVPDSVVTEYGAAQLCYAIVANKFKKRFK